MFPRPIEPKRATAAYVLLLALLCALGCSKSEAPAPPAEPAIPPAAEGVQQAKIIADSKGFSPSEVQATKGKPLSLVFVRTTDSTCATKVVFPELKLEKDLPLNTPVSLDIPTGEARRLTFQCGMGMYKSAVLVR